MPLNEYLLYMQTIDSSHDSYKENEEDLYITSRKNKQSVLENAGTYEIRETEEDNYEESHEGNIRKNC
jgi:PHD/YefM family antitoxin component YafN of YafNO toxin-antitoxin module